jgi:transposase
VDGGVIFEDNRLSTNATQELPMLHDRSTVAATTAIQGHNGAITASLELSTKNWIVTSHTPGSEKLSAHALEAGDAAGLLALLARLLAKAQRSLGRSVEVITVQEAGLDGFWLHRLLEREGVRSYVVDAASIPMPRRSRRAKSDRIDGEVLWRTLAAFLRGEPRVCSMVRPPSPAEEDRRRLVRERDRLIRERIRHCNLIRGLLAAQGIRGYDPLRRDRRAALEKLRSADGRALAAQLKREIMRALARIEQLIAQIAELERERLEFVKDNAIASQLCMVKGIGPEFASALALEVFFRTFGNRRQIAAYVGLSATPWRSGKIEEEQGISKAGNRRARKVMIELAWLWLRHQRSSALSKWFFKRLSESKGRKLDRRIFIVALARKLIVALWRFVTTGEIPDGAVMKTA